MNKHEHKRRAKQSRKSFSTLAWQLISPEKVKPRPARIDFAASSIPAYPDLASVIDCSNVAELARTQAGF
jgi:hypothetical protein